MSDPAFERAIAAIDAANDEDPHSLEFGGRTQPKERLHGELATHWVRLLVARPSDALLLAARAHHLRRWELLRSDYPAGPAGYHRWRRDQQLRHAEQAGALLAEAGYDAATIERVGDLIRKRGLGRDPEVQVLEDALCLVFLETQLGAFACEHPDEKVVDILVKSMRKMSADGRAAASRLPFGEREAALLARASAGLEAEG